MGKTCAQTLCLEGAAKHLGVVDFLQVFVGAFGAEEILRGVGVGADDDGDF